MTTTTTNNSNSNEIYKNDNNNDNNNNNQTKQNETNDQRPVDKNGSGGKTNRNGGRKKFNGGKSAAIPSESAADPANAAETTTNAQINEATAPTAETTPQGESWSCLFCSDPIYHSIDECAEFIARDRDGRFNMIKIMGVCAACYGRGHIARECDKNVRCDTCGGRHATLMHFDPPSQPTS